MGPILITGAKRIPQYVLYIVTKWNAFERVSKKQSNSHEEVINNVGQLNCFIVQLAIKNIKLYMKDLICVDSS